MPQRFQLVPPGSREQLACSMVQMAMMVDQCGEASIATA